MRRYRCSHAASQGRALPLNPGASLQALAQLSTDLTLSVMRAAPDIPTLFRSLPPCMHPLALRAHLPSIDAARTLSATLPDGISAAHTARAAAALQHLTSISLAVRGWRFPPRLRAFRRLLRYAERAPCLVSLDVSNALPPHLDDAARALAESMPRLCHLSRLVMCGDSFLPGAPPPTPRPPLANSSLSPLRLCTRPCRPAAAALYRSSDIQAAPVPAQCMANKQGTQVSKLATCRP